MHGTDRPREMWNIGDETTPSIKAELKFDRLRYALLPLHLFAGRRASRRMARTMMRPLVMDFRSDAKARDVTDQYMFGPAFLVSPVTEYKARSRAGLPARAGSGWYDFWTGARRRRRSDDHRRRAVRSMPLFVRAGSIVPVGPELQYIGEKPARPDHALRLRRAPTARFSLYEDDGRTYGYERGEFARIPLRWNDATRTLTIGARDGCVPGMPRAADVHGRARHAGQAGALRRGAGAGRHAPIYGTGGERGVLIFRLKGGSHGKAEATGRRKPREGGSHGRRNHGSG